MKCRDCGEYLEAGRHRSSRVCFRCKAANEVRRVKMKRRWKPFYGWVGTAIQK